MWRNGCNRDISHKRVDEDGRMEKYQVRKIEQIEEIQVRVPGSKSITNRALLLAALSDKRCVLRGSYSAMIQGRFWTAL